MAEKSRNGAMNIAPVSAMRERLALSSIVPPVAKSIIIANRKVLSLNAPRN